MNFKLNNAKKSFGIILFSIVFLSYVHAQDKLIQYKPSPTSSDEVLKVINTPQNQNDVELIMSIFKSIEEKNITDIDKKIEFVDTFKVSDDIKDIVKRDLKQDIQYSNYQKISYGIYQIKNGCNHHSKANLSDYLLDHIRYNFRDCAYQPLYICNPF